eukprot:CAMPEP_0194211782 /NCGR_PEP_ID=MMETSP0156-20130528/11154_1 /TAXON_ID=33649 /ORGANISM="Thalassionema nitzschioides, Strain L26-B" /LENGTH=564 /DNA_ID=CAMNT_0038939439 /DNA_START=49 /DNA_END=1743 /DNA_ORIENTATION=-
MDTIIPLTSEALPPAKGKKVPPQPVVKPVEAGLWLSLGVVALYFYALLGSMNALPKTTQPGKQRIMFGKNWNVAVNKYETAPGGVDMEDDEGDDIEPEDTTTTAKQKKSMKRTTSVQLPPVSQWPPPSALEPTFEIVHPGDPKARLQIPEFWSPPIHDGGLMTREVAMQIGACAVPDASGNFARGDECPVDERTIYFAIASYRDFQCRQTLETAFLRAKNPRRIRVGVVDQIVHGEDPACNEPIKPCDTDPHQALCLYQDQIDVYEMPAALSVGPVFARHIGHRLYRGEYYYTQSDAHVSYTQHWDADIISQMEATHNDMAVLTTYLTDVQGSISPEGASLRHTRPIMCNTDYEGGAQGQHLRHLSQPERVPSIHGSPQMQPYWAAGYSFSRGHFVVNVPYDLYQPMIFQGEEMSIGIRGFTVGYDFYAPERSVCFHHYATGANAKVRNKVPHFWENGPKYTGTGKKAMQRLLGIVHMNPEIPISDWIHTDEDVYGLGGVRTPEKFYETFGIDVVHKRTQHHLCQFVDKGKMHNDFTPFLRKDGIGIDYDQITYQFTDPMPGVQ